MSPVKYLGIDRISEDSFREELSFSELKQQSIAGVNSP